MTEIEIPNIDFTLTHYADNTIEISRKCSFYGSIDILLNAIAACIADEMVKGSRSDKIADVYSNIIKAFTSGEIIDIAVKKSIEMTNKILEERKGETQHGN